MLVAKLTAVFSARSGANGIELLRVERQQVLHALQRIECHNAREVEPEQRQRIADPGLLFRRIDAGQAIQAVLDRRQGTLRPAEAIDGARDVPAERLHGGDNQRGEQRDLQPALPGHGTWSGVAPVGRVRLAQALT